MFFLAAALGAAKKVGASALAGALHPGNKKDPERAQHAADDLRKALAGDLSAAEDLYQQKDNSGDAYGRQQFQAAWDELSRRDPEMAARAVPGGAEKAQNNFTDPEPTTAQQLSAEAGGFWNRVRADAGDTAQRILAGAGAKVGNKIGGSNSRISIPTNVKTIGMVLVVALLVGAFLYWYAKKK